MKNRAMRLPSHPWTIRLSNVRLPVAASPRTAVAAPRPGIAARWKPRDRVSAAGN